MSVLSRSEPVAVDSALVKVVIHADGPHLAQESCSTIDAMNGLTN